MPLQQTFWGNTIGKFFDQVFPHSAIQPDTNNVQQLAAALWLERYLNQLQTQLNGYLNPVTGVTVIPSVEQLLQILIDDLNAALMGEFVAIAKPREEPDCYEIQQIAGSQSSSSICISRQTVILLSEGKELEIGQVLTPIDLEQLERLDWQSAWELRDSQGTIGWLIVASVPISTDAEEEPLRQSLRQSLRELRAQLVTRAIAQVMQAIRQAQHVQQLTQQYQYLQAQNQELAQISQLKSEFLANTSHEIRTPLSSILGFTHLLREQGYNPGNLRHQEYLRIILSSGQHLLGLINDILDLSKIEANQLDLQRETVEVNEICKTAFKLVQEKANDKGLALKLNIASDVSTLVADPLRLKQMLFNLLFNALKFTHRGSVGLDVQQVENYLQFTVWDTGTGISEEQQQLLFRPYTQLTNATQEEGTGLGLALTQKLAELHGGWIRAESVLDQGSRFTIALPLAPDEEHQRDPKTSKREETNPPFSAFSPLRSSSPAARQFYETDEANSEAAQSKVPIATRLYHILLVEDNHHNARLLITYLCKLGYEVTWAQNSEGMWQALKQSLPALILMDIHLSGVDGLTLIKQLQAQTAYRTIPIIAQTAMAMKGDREKCLEAGACDYVSKPIDLSALAQTIAKYSQKDLKNED